MRPNPQPLLDFSFFVKRLASEDAEKADLGGDRAMDMAGDEADGRRWDRPPSFERTFFFEAEHDQGLVVEVRRYAKIIENLGY